MPHENLTEPTAQDQDPNTQALAQALRSDIPHLYVNSFVNAIGSGDVIISLGQNDKAVATVNMSYTLAKTLAEKLGVMLADLERRTGNNIMTTDDINHALGKEQTQ